MSSCLGKKHPPFVMIGWVWPNIMIRLLANKWAWLNEQHELLMSANRQALKHIKQSAKKSQMRTGGKSLQIPIGNLVLLRDHPEGCNKIQDNYKSETICHQLIITRTPVYVHYSIIRQKGS